MRPAAGLASSPRGVVICGNRCSNAGSAPPSTPPPPARPPPPPPSVRTPRHNARVEMLFNESNWYKGEVTIEKRVRAGSVEHKVHFEDGDVRWVNLREQEEALSLRYLQRERLPQQQARSPLSVLWQNSFPLPSHPLTLFVVRRQARLRRLREWRRRLTKAMLQRTCGLFSRHVLTSPRIPLPLPSPLSSPHLICGQARVHHAVEDEEDLPFAISTVFFCYGSTFGAPMDGHGWGPCKDAAVKFARALRAAQGGARYDDPHQEVLRHGKKLSQAQQKSQPSLTSSSLRATRKGGSSGGQPLPSHFLLLY